jgi:hypothetical protein
MLAYPPSFFHADLPKRDATGDTIFSSPAIPLPAYKTWQTADEVITYVDQLLDDYTYGQIASLLNKRGLHSGKGNPFTATLVGNICRDYALKSRWERLRGRGLLTLEEMTDLLEVSSSTVKVWRRHGLLKGHLYNDKHECLFETPEADKPFKWQGRKLTKRYPLDEFVSDNVKEV